MAWVPINGVGTQVRVSAESADTLEADMGAKVCRRSGRPILPPGHDKRDAVDPEERSRAALSLAEFSLACRFLRQLPSYLRRPVTIEEARSVLEQRLARREADFLDLVQRAVYAHPQSPYRVLLDWAGCEYEDLVRLVEDRGVEGALRVLLRSGVYLTVDELKGRRPVVRGSRVLRVDTAALRNPLASPHVAARSGASRSAGTPVVNSLDSIRDRAVNTCLTLAARGGLLWEKGVWAVPGSLTLILRYAAFGGPPTGWFSCVEPRTPGLHPRYRWSERALRGVAALHGVPIPAQRHAAPADPVPVLRWLRDVMDRGGVPHLWAFPSAAVQACRLALDTGVDISGARMTVTGEPVTVARLAVMRAAGVEAVPDYGSAETGGFVAYGCLAPRTSDDVHVFHDLHAIVQPQPDGLPGLPSGALCVSSLRATSPLVLLNASMGDQAVVDHRACGCPLERLGWTTHLCVIRSFEKLTAAGITLLDTDVVRVLEETLPARFGGGPLDYQLVEGEGPDGTPSLRLLVHPRLGAVPEAELADAFLRAISTGGGAERIAATLWRDARIPVVVRQAPMATPGGKVLHVHAGPVSADG